MKKILIIKELSRTISVKLRIVTGRLDKTSEVARFSKTGFGYCMLSAGVRWHVGNLNIDEIEFRGTEKVAEDMVRMGILEKSYDTPLTPVSS